MKFSIVDAFTEELFGGNPAGVVIISQGESFPSKARMIQTAAELRYSETAFVKPLGNQVYELRYCTPVEEVELCGHATIGAFYALLDRGLVKTGNTYLAQTRAGRLNVSVEADQILMDMATPRLEEEIPKGSSTRELYQIMGLEERDQGKVADKDVFLPCQKASTGLMDILMPVKDEGELEKIQPDFPALAKLSEAYRVVGVHAFTLNSRDGRIHARNFAPLYEIDEEAATGTSNGALTYYLYRHGLMEEDKINPIIQGEKMKRPSRISTRLTMEEGRAKVMVGGFAVTLAEGEIHI